MNIENMLFEYPHMLGTIQKLNNELNQIIRNKMQITDNLKSKSESLQSTQSSAASNSNIHAVEKIIDKYDGSVKYMIQRISEMIEIKINLNRVLKSLEMEEFMVIDYRYFQKYKWSLVPSLMGCSERQCHKYKVSAMAKLTAELEGGMERQYSVAYT